MITKSRFIWGKRDSEKDLAARCDDITRNTTNVDVGRRARNDTRRVVFDPAENMSFDDVNRGTRVEKCQARL